jgi:uncharacterized protein (TIGR03437 family)
MLIQAPVVLFLTFAATLSANPQLVLNSASAGPVHVFPGSNGTAQTFNAYNIGTGALNLTATASATWLAASVGALQNCATPTGTCYPIQVSLNTTALVAGFYTEYVTVTDPNAVDSPQQITITVNVAGIPSSVSIYVTPEGGPTPSAYAPVFTQGTVTGAATTQSGGNWLSFVTGGIQTTTPYAVQVAAQKGMASGNYTGSVVLTGANPADNKTINVALTVTASPIVVSITTPVPLSGFPGGTNPSTTVSFTNIGEGTLTVTGALASSSTGNFLSASVASANAISVAANPGTLAPGIYTGSVQITSNAANNSQVSVPIVFTVEAAGTPLIYSAGIVNIGDFSPDPAASGEILAVFGDQLAAPGTSAQNTGLPPLATTLGSVQVLVNGTPAPLYFASPRQVNFQLPYEAPTGQVTVVQVVSNSKAGNTRPVNVIGSVPRLLAWPSSVISGGYGIVVNQDFSLPLPSPVSGYVTHPAKAGDTITIYCTGLGQTTPPAITGAAASITQLETIPSVSVVFGGGFSGPPATTVPAVFAGLTPTAVGLYQVNAAIPAGVAIGAAVPLTVSVNGTLSNSVNIAISQ